MINKHVLSFLYHNSFGFFFEHPRSSFIMARALFEAAVLGNFGDFARELRFVVPLCSIT